MNNLDQKNIAEIYEEGIWDRVKASASGIKAGVGSLVRGQGYAKANQQAKGSSLMGQKKSQILADIDAMEKDLAKYKDDNSKSVIVGKLANLRSVISSF